MFWTVVRSFVSSVLTARLSFCWSVGVFTDASTTMSPRGGPKVLLRQVSAQWNCEWENVMVVIPLGVPNVGPERSMAVA
eukprot:6536445-Pyramimonas_sp.AAC.1